MALSEKIVTAVECGDPTIQYCLAPTREELGYNPGCRIKFGMTMME
jgi:hypothetical protein